MFDDPQPKPGQTPGNLPTGEPDDIFADTKAVEPADMVDRSPDAIGSAVDAGLLRPKTRDESVLDRMESQPTTLDDEAYKIKSPSVGRGVLVAVIVAVALIIIGGGGWWIYIKYMRTGQGDKTAPFVTPSEEPASETSNTILPASDNGDVLPNNGQNGISSDITDDDLLFGAPIDSDGDGLDDLREVELGTNPQNGDTDGDELRDGDEVVGWGTDPKNPDTDGDTFLDGKEVKAGYSPSGPGKYTVPPSTTPAS